MNAQIQSFPLLTSAVAGLIERTDAKLARSAAEKGFANLAAYKACLNTRIAAKRAARAAREYVITT